MNRTSVSLSGTSNPAHAKSQPQNRNSAILTQPYFHLLAGHATRSLEGEQNRTTGAMGSKVLPSPSARTRSRSFTWVSSVRSPPSLLSVTQFSTSSAKVRAISPTLPATGTTHPLPGCGAASTRPSRNRARFSTAEMARHCRARNLPRVSCPPTSSPVSACSPDFRFAQTSASAVRWLNPRRCSAACRCGSPGTTGPLAAA